MASISRALERIKQDLERYVPQTQILQACQQIGHTWRQRQFDPVCTLYCFLLQILCGNTSLQGLQRAAKVPMTASAYCQARMRLPLALLQWLLAQCAQAMRQANAAPAQLWCGLRVWLVDGSSTLTPDLPPLAQRFGYPPNQTPGCGFPVPKLLGVFDAASGLILEALFLPMHGHEASQVQQVHPRLGKGDLLLGDRGLCSYAHLALLHLREVAGCFRMHQRQKVDFRPHRRCRKGKRDKGRPTSEFVCRLGRHDQLVRWKRPQDRPDWMQAAQWKRLPETLLVREIRYALPYRKGMRTREVTLACTLVDPVLYPKPKIAELYGLRWQVETDLGQLKTTLGMRQLKSQSVAGIEKEFAVYCLAWNLLRMVMLEAARRQQVACGRISFIDALRWLREADPGEALPELVVNPLRPGRYQPRVIKDRNDSYPRMTRPRSFLKKHPGYYGK
jgi:Transposase DDE domain